MDQIAHEPTQEVLDAIQTSHCNISNDGSLCPLSDKDNFPVELRRQIFSHCIRSSRRLYLITSANIASRIGERDGVPNVTPLLLVNRQIREEFLDIFYRYNKFAVEINHIHLANMDLVLSHLGAALERVMQIPYAKISCLHFEHWHPWDAEDDIDTKLYTILVSWTRFFLYHGSAFGTPKDMKKKSVVTFLSGPLRGVGTKRKEPCVGPIPSPHGCPSGYRSLIYLANLGVTRSEEFRAHKVSVTGVLIEYLRATTLSAP
ncbi:hypothetical protein BDV97DRAFT_133468 [Delphinella strobiligena]|nr:hypothetical protein BDV97DRAFT_133468 [Delphinella strobiligena]